jgi:class 3 adenylate cyclase
MAIKPPTKRFQLPEAHQVTNVFVDLCGSTDASEKLQNNQRLFELLDRWQRLTACILCSYGGMIGASDSDMVMGYFKGVETETLASSRAILSAKRIRYETIRFGEEHHIPLDVHIGIHCGNVEIGCIGPEVRSNLTTIGPPVNIAARLESKANKGEIFVSEQIKSMTRLNWDGDYAGEYTLKGVKQPVQCYRVQSVGLSSIPEESLNEAEWVFATLEAQALERMGRDAESLELAQRAASSQNALADLNPRLILIPQEICIWVFLSLNQPTKATHFIHQFAKCAKELSAPLESAHANFYLAKSLEVQRKYREAIQAYARARYGYEKCGNKRKIADSLFYAGVCYQRLENSEEAVRLFDEAKKKYHQFINYQEGDEVEIGKACLEYSMLLANDPWQVIEILTLAMKKFEDTCQFRFLLRALNNMSYVCNSVGRPTDAENYARRALDLARNVDPIDGTITALINIGASIEMKCNLGMISKADSVQEALTEARYNYQQASDLAHRLGIEELCEKMNQYIQRVSQKLQQLDLGR